MNVQWQLAEALRTHRGDQSQADVAHGMRRLGFPWSQSTVSAVESARRDVTVHELAGLCSVLRARIHELIPELVPTLLHRVPLQGEPSETPDDIERHAARALSRPPYRRAVTPEQIQSTSIRLWGCRMRDERDRRLPGGSARGVRGHITRRLLAEIDAAL